MLKVMRRSYDLIAVAAVVDYDDYDHLLHSHVILSLHT